MAALNVNPEAPESRTRPVGGTEYSWCRAAEAGTGITVLALLLSKSPDIPLLETTLHKLQNAYPILRAKLVCAAKATPSFSYTIPPNPHFQIKSFDVSSASHPLLRHQSNPTDTSSVSPFHRILEHELNQNPWSNLNEPVNSEADVFFASVYTLPDSKWVVALRLHTSVCDRTSAVSIGESFGVMSTGEREEIGTKGEVLLGIEELIPKGKANKPFWARGVDMLGYSLNSFRLANLEFKDFAGTRSSEVVRLKMSSDETDRLLAECKAREIKLSGVITAAAFMAARSSKNLPDHQWEKYAVVTIIDCRKLLDPPLRRHDIGFYHSALLNTHDVKGGEELWELASRCCKALTNAMNSNKHFSDIGDLNFLMCKAIENPGLTPASSLRTSFLSVFSDTVIVNSDDSHGDIGLEDCMGCASVHGVGPSVAVFDTIRNGQLDCLCVYPSPLHSREQMQDLIDSMKRILLEGCN